MQDHYQLAVFIAFTFLFGGEGGISVCSGTLQVFLKSTYVSPHLCVSYHLHASITGEKPYVHIIGLLSLYMPMNVILGV